MHVIYLEYARLLLTSAALRFAFLLAGCALLILPRTDPRRVYMTGRFQRSLDIYLEVLERRNRPASVGESA